MSLVELPSFKMVLRSGVVPYLLLLRDFSTFFIMSSDAFPATMQAIFMPYPWLAASKLTSELELGGRVRLLQLRRRRHRTSKQAGRGKQEDPGSGWGVGGGGRRQEIKAVGRRPWTRPWSRERDCSVYFSFFMYPIVEWMLSKVFLFFLRNICVVSTMGQGVMH
jgi:hypothetical protein